MRTVLARRVRYLQNRAVHLAERRRPEGAIDDWQTAMTRASLHVEVAEGATALGEIDQARFAIRLAVPQFLQLRMPFGAALQRAFLADHGALTTESDGLMREWKTILDERERGESAERVETASVSDVVNTPQQWAYYGLSSALSRGPTPTLTPRIDSLREALVQWLLVPVGRMRFPMDQYLYIIEYCEDARRSRGDVGEPERFVVEILAKQLLALFRALQYASRNRYLWSRLLAPAPWFDFDVALLVAAVRAAPGKLSYDLGRAVAEAVPSEVSRYAAEYVAAVADLTGPAG